MAVWFWRAVLDDCARGGSQEGGGVYEGFGALGYGCEVFGGERRGECV